MRVLAKLHFRLVGPTEDTILPESVLDYSKDEFKKAFHKVFSVGEGVFTPDEELNDHFDYFNRYFGKYEIKAYYRLAIPRDLFAKCKKAAKPKLERIVERLADSIKSKFPDVGFNIDYYLSYDFIQYDDPSERPKRRYYKAETNLMLFDDISGPDTDEANEEYEDEISGLLGGLKKSGVEKDGKKLKIKYFDFDTDIPLEVTITGASSAKDAEDFANEFSDIVITPAVTKIVNSLRREYDVKINWDEDSGFQFEEREDLYE
jgi:hypothetical protein